MTRNEQLDADVLGAIQAGKTELVRISTSLATAERVIDRSLQRLRRKGKIKYERKAWSLVEVES